MGGSFAQFEPWIRLLAGSLLAGGLFAAAFLSLRWWLANRSSTFHLLLAILLVCGAALSLIAPFRYADGWIIQIILIAILAGGLWLLAERQESLKETVLTVSLVAVVGSLVLSSLLFWGRQDLTNESLRKSLDETVVALSQEEGRLSEVSSQLSALPIVDSILAGTLADSGSELQRLLVEHQLSSLTVVSMEGRVLVRAGQTALGDNLLTEHPWLITVLKNEALSGRVVNRLNQPELAAAVPLSRQSRQVGALLLTRELADQFLADMPASTLAVGTHAGLASATAGSAAETQLLQSADIDEVIRAEAIPRSGPHRFVRRVVVDDHSYRLSGLVTDSLTQAPIVFITTSIPTQPLRAPIMAWVIALVCMTLAAGFASFLTGRTNEKMVGGPRG